MRVGGVTPVGRVGRVERCARVRRRVRRDCRVTPADARVLFVREILNPEESPGTRRA